MSSGRLLGCFSYLEDALNYYICVRSTAISMAAHSMHNTLNTPVELLLNYDDDDPEELTNIHPNKIYITESESHDFFHPNCTKCLTLLHINCRSLRKNVDSIHHLLTICHPLTALALSET